MMHYALQRTLTFSATIGVIGVLVTSGTVWAVSIDLLPDSETTGNFTVAPAKVEINADPGVITEREIRIENRTGKTQTFSFSVEDMAGTESGSDAVQFFGNAQGPYTLRSIVDVPETVIVQSGEVARVPIVVRLPEDATPGGRYGGLFVSATPESAATGASVSTRIGVLLFVRVSGEVAESGALESFGTIGDRFFFTEAPISFAVLFRNTGTVHLNPYGAVRITTLLGDEVAFLPLDPWFALPESLRTREVRFEEAPSFGVYRATAEVNRGYADIVDTRSVVFVIMPIDTMRVGAFVLIGLIALTFILRRKRSTI